MAAKHRITINLEDDEYEALVEIAERSDRSMAWVGRRAILDFILARERKEVPLLAGADSISVLARRSAQ
jgi:predicted transcriptional regulator